LPLEGEGKMRIEDQLACARANVNAYKAEIEGLQKYIKKLRSDLTAQKDNVANFQCSDVLFALREEYEWLVEENKEMEKNPDYYPEVDHYGLPYCKKVLESIAKKANVELVSK
jgi:capsule polysaccharide export protein KpsE/RkpR